MWLVNGGKFQFDLTGSDPIESELFTSDEEIDEACDDEELASDDDATFIGTFEDSDDGEVAVIVTQIKVRQTKNQKFVHLEGLELTCL